MILVYKLVKDERSGDVVPKLVGDYPDDHPLETLGEGEFQIYEGSKATLDDDIERPLPLQFKAGQRVVVKVPEPKPKMTTVQKEVP